MLVWGSMLVSLSLASLLAAWYFNFLVEFDRYINLQKETEFHYTFIGVAPAVTSGEKGDLLTRNSRDQGPPSTVEGGYGSCFNTQCPVG